MQSFKDGRSCFLEGLSQVNRMGGQICKLGRMWTIRLENNMYDGSTSSTSYRGARRKMRCIIICAGPSLKSSGASGAFLKVHYLGKKTAEVCHRNTGAHGLISVCLIPNAKKTKGAGKYQAEHEDPTRVAQGYGFGLGLEAVLVRSKTVMSTVLMHGHRPVYLSKASFGSIADD